MQDISAIVAAHGDRVWRIAIRLLNHEEDAQDCYQQTFLDALRLRGETVANWGSMLANIATRRAMDRLRKRYRERTAFAAADVEPAGESPPDGRLLGDELRQRVRETLARLPEKQAEAFWLRHVEDFATEDVARQLDVKPSHVRVLVHRAVQQLRTALTPIYGLEMTRGEGNDRK